MQFIDKLFFKKRYVLIREEKIDAKIINGNYLVRVISDQNELNSLSLGNSNIIAGNRLKNNIWLCFIMIDTDTNKIAAYYWSIFSAFKSTWHDNYLIEPGTALLCNAFVEPVYRNQGLYKQLIAFAHNYLLENCVQKIFTIIERNNHASLKANKAVGLQLFSYNFLIKFMGFNILSVFQKQSKINLVLLGSRLFKLIVYKKP